MGSKWAAAFVLALALALIGLQASHASAAVPPLLWQTPEGGESGQGAGQMLRPTGVAVDPATGNVFVADGGNARIEEFDPWGQFVKAWGWGVVASGPDDQPARNERQEVDVGGAGSNFKLIYQNPFQNGGTIAQITGSIGSGASAGEVQTALEELESLGPGDVAVSGLPGGPFTVEFTGSDADSDIPPLTVVGTSSTSATTLQNGGSFEVCIAANGDVCQAGQRGGYAAGEFPNLLGLAIDGVGHLFVDEATRTQIAVSGAPEPINLRVQSFDLQGNFLTMWGGDVDKTSGADICTRAALEGGDECGSGVPGDGLGEFRSSGPGKFGVGIAIGPEGHVFTGDEERIQEFEASGVPVSPAIAVPGEIVDSLAVDSLGDLFATYKSEVVGDVGVKPGVHELSPDGASIRTFGAEAPGVLTQIQAVTVDIDDGVYAAGRPSGLAPFSIVRFSPMAEVEINAAERFGEGAGISGLATSSACGIEGEEVLATRGLSGGGTVLSAYGPPPDPTLCPPPAIPPRITDQLAASVTTTGAILRGKINPHFWNDTRYYVEYGVGKCSEGGCQSQQPTAPGALLSGGVSSAPRDTSDISLSGLKPGTTYHYRFVAKSSGGGPVFGSAEGDGEATALNGSEGTFTTAALPSPPDTNCPNQVFRIGPSATLPDCRAYEMVSPVDKGNADVVALGVNRLTAFNQASITGEALAYSSSRAFGDAQSAPYTSEYIAFRGENGWSSTAVSPPRGVNLTAQAATLDSQYKLFSPELCSGWLVDETSLLLAPGAVEDFSNLYKRQNCDGEAGTYFSLSTATPPHAPRSTYYPEMQGVSADGSRVMFRAGDKLAPNAPEPSGFLLYESFANAKPRFVCVPPSGPPVKGCSAGTAIGGLTDARHETVSHAMSADGSRIFWSDTSLGEGKIYVRVNGKETLPVSEGGEALSGGTNAQFWTAAADGSKAIYSVGGLSQGEADLYEFAVGNEETRLVASKVSGVLGANESASRIYFISEEALNGGQLGEPNLYLYEAGSPAHFKFVASLSANDAAQWEATDFSPGNADPNKRTSIVSADGLHVAFMSTASPTGVDNIDLNSGEADAEVYVYNAESELLSCASCNPTGARPAGRSLGKDTATPSNLFWAAAQIPHSENQLYAPQVLSDGGNRLFFESFEPLVNEDTNSAEDVYEWEAPGEGNCGESNSSFRPVNHGCVSLISSGKSPSDSELIDASPSGHDVFIATESSLLPQDPGLIDIYDARVDGGFPLPPLPPAPCEGENCQRPFSPPNDPAPASSSFVGAGNLTGSSSKKQRCAKGKVVTKKGCAKKKHKPRKSKKKQSRSSHRAGRKHGGAKKKKHKPRKSKKKQSRSSHRAGRKHGGAK